MLQVKDFEKEAKKLRPIYSSGWNYKINFDGHLIYNGSDTTLCSSFVQCYRNGVVEFVNSSMFPDYGEGNKIIPSVLYEEELINTVELCLEYFQNINMECPIFLFLSFVNVKDYEMAVDRSKYWLNKAHYTIDRNILITPETIIDNYNIDIKATLKPVFDSIWNACGLKESLNYDKK